MKSFFLLGLVFFGLGRLGAQSLMHQLPVRLNHGTVISQNDVENYKVWGDFLSESYPQEPYMPIQTIYVKDSVSNANHGWDKISYAYLEDVVNDKVHDYYGRHLKDSLWLTLFDAYDGIGKRANYKLGNLFGTMPFRLKVIGNRKIKRFAKLPGFDKRLYTFSDCVFDPAHSRCMFYYTSYMGKLSASGYIVFMEKKEDKWLISYMITMWMS